MPVDPYLIHAYWEIADADLLRVQTEMGPSHSTARPVLRIYDITYIDFDGTNAHHLFDIEIDLRPRNWYVHLWSPEKTYCADLGFTIPEGRFFPVVRSNIVHVPRSEPSPRSEVTLWGPIRPKSDPTGAGPGPAPPVAVEVIESNSQVRRVEGWSAPPLSAQSTEHITLYARAIGTVPGQRTDTGEVRSAETAGKAAPDALPERRDLTMECERRFVAGLSSG
jgi:hypothetical protein